MGIAGAGPPDRNSCSSQCRLTPAPSLRRRNHKSVCAREFVTAQASVAAASAVVPWHPSALGKDGVAPAAARVRLVLATAGRAVAHGVALEASAARHDIVRGSRDGIALLRHLRAATSRAAPAATAAATVGLEACWVANKAARLGGASTPSPAATSAAPTSTPASNAIAAVTIAIRTHAVSRAASLPRSGSRWLGTRTGAT